MAQGAHDFETLRAELDARVNELGLESSRQGSPSYGPEPREKQDAGERVPSPAAPRPGGPMLENQPLPPVRAEKVYRTLEEVERDYILRVLETVNWRISGPKGAARILGLNASTLRSRMKKLGVSREITRKREI